MNFRNLNTEFDLKNINFHSFPNKKPHFQGFPGGGGNKISNQQVCCGRYRTASNCLTNGDNPKILLLQIALSKYLKLFRSDGADRMNQCIESIQWQFFCDQCFDHI